MGMTLGEKIIARAAGVDFVKSGWSKNNTKQRVEVKWE